MIIDPAKSDTKELFGILTSSVVPRPIAFVSSVDKEGHVNLSPFSFFNVFSANPPILVFSPSRRVRDNTIKHTLENVMEVPEVTINIANRKMAEQLSLSSAEYAKDVNEFVKSGFTERVSTNVRPPLVAEAPVSFECKVNDVILLGSEGGAGNLVLAEIVMIHINNEVLDIDGNIDPLLLDPIARLGTNLYGSLSSETLFEIDKPLSTPGIGVDALPAVVRLSDVLSGNDLGKLGGLYPYPSKEEIANYKNDSGASTNVSIQERHIVAKELIKNGDVRSALLHLLS